jgi:hypothetical protein
LKIYRWYDTQSDTVTIPTTPVPTLLKTTLDCSDER